jgi:hypothetical protein
MPVTKNGNGEIVETPFLDRRDFEETGVVRDDTFAISDDIDRTKQIKFRADSLAADSSVTIAAGASSGSITLTLPTSSGTLVTAAGEAPAFQVIQTPNGTSPTADSPSDTLTLAEGGGMTITGNSTTDTITFAAGATAPHLTRYVSKNGSDSNSGSMIQPFLTIQAALNSIGNPANANEFSADLTARCQVIVGPGVYTENLTIPNRQVILLDLQGACVVGNVTWAIDGDPLHDNLVGANQQKLTIRGHDMRSMYTGAGIPLTGINGNLNLVIDNAGSFIAQVHLMQTGVSGNITVDSNTLGGSTAQIHITDGFILGDLVVTPGKSLVASLYATNSDTSSSKNLGGVSGAVTLAILRNARFNRAVVASGAGGGRWFNTTFNSSLAHDLTGYSGTIDMDANTYASYDANIPTKGSETVNRIDTAKGVKFTPAEGLVATNVQAAIEELAAGGGATGDMMSDGSVPFTSKASWGAVDSNFEIYHDPVSNSNNWKIGDVSGVNTGRYIALNDTTFAIYGPLSMGSHTISDVTDPTNDQDAATKAYADTKATGAASSTDEALVRFDSTTGKVIQNSGVTLNDNNTFVVPGGSSTNPTFRWAATGGGDSLGKLWFGSANATTELYSLGFRVFTAYYSAFVVEPVIYAGNGINFSTGGATPHMKLSSSDGTFKTVDFCPDGSNAKWRMSDVRNETMLPLKLMTYTVATLPSAATHARSIVWVSDESGGACMAVSDGTNWKRVYDNATVS